MAENQIDRPANDIDVPLDTDVMFGRGMGTNFHPGNVRFRRIVEENKLRYREALRINRPLIVLDIVREVRACSPPGRFIRRNEETGRWFEIGDEQARLKTAQALRERRGNMAETQIYRPANDIDVPLDTDVMFGRRMGTRFHPGNVRFRRIVEENKLRYRDAPRYEKSSIVLDIVRGVRAWSPPGRFIQRNQETGRWFDVGDEQARVKTAQALRSQALRERRGYGVAPA